MSSATQNLWMHLLDAFIGCNTSPEDWPPCTDHYPIISMLDIEPMLSYCTPQRNYRDVEWDNFQKHLGGKLSGLQTPVEIRSIAGFNKTLENLTWAIEETIKEKVSMMQPTPYTKKWWTQNLTKAKAKAFRSSRKAYQHKLDHKYLIHKQYCYDSNDYSDLIKKTKQEH